MAMSTTAAWAEAYREAGFPVFPSNGKVPAKKGWQQMAADGVDVDFWWPVDGGYDIAAATGHTFDVFDIEVAHLERLKGKPRPAAPTVATGRGGLHFFVKPLGLGNRRLLLDGVHIGELKGLGGFVLLPPAVTTEQYTWLYAPTGLPVAEAPDWLRELVYDPPPPRLLRSRQSREEVIDALEALCEAVAHQESGNRNSVLYWAAMRCVEEGIPAEAAWPALYRAAEASGLVAADGQRSVEQTLRSALGDLS